MFQNETIASAILDRLLHRSHVISINEKLYRTHRAAIDRKNFNNEI